MKIPIHEKPAPVTVSLPPSMVARLDTVASETKRSRSSVLRMIVEDFFNDRGEGHE